MATLESNGSIEVGIWIGQSVGGRYLSVRGKVLDRTRRGKALRAIGLLIDKTAEKAMEERMLSMAMSDGLTGIANRRSFDGSLRSEWRRCKRALDPITLVMIDIDNFKMFNDTYGHLVGDEAIRAIASSLLALLNREGDFVARFGGEEFAMILPATDFDGAKKVGEKIVREIRKIKLSQASDWNFSVSVGTATTTFLKDHGRSVDLLSKSDEALYEAKREGKDRWVSKTL
jgi:diguanylate cyclase (GGDEF)-like protein